LGQGQDHHEDADAVPTGLPEDSVNVDQVEHLFDHLVCPCPPLGAKLGARIGIELIVNIDLVLLVLVYVVLQGIQRLTVLVDSKARGPDNEGHGQESTGDTKRIGFSILRSNKTSDKFMRFDDGTCMEKEQKKGERLRVRTGLGDQRKHVGETDGKVDARCNWNRRQNWESKKADVGSGVTFGGGEGPIRRVSSSSPALTLP
jgi:hypothetical protein